MQVINRNWIPENKKQKRVLFLLLFSMVFFVVYVCAYAFFLRDGKSYIWNYDGVKQHYAALSYLGTYYREVFFSWLHGTPSLPMMDFSIGMGEDVITTLNFYGLGDPLTLLAAVVPESGIESLYNFLVIFRIYLAGLSFSWMCRQKGKDYRSTLIGALAYAFSGYVLHVAVKHPFFVIPMILLPLSVIGVERALDQKKPVLLTFLVFATAWNGFYFFYMNTVFLVIYALIHMVCRRTGHVARGIARCAVSYACGVSMAAVLFWPAVAAYLSSTRSESGADPGNLFLFSAKRYGYIFSRLIGTPRITWDYLGMVSLLLPAIVVLFAGRLGKNKELKVNIIIWTALMLLPFGGFMLNGFSYVSGRFTYLVTFVYAFGIVEMLPALLRLRRRTMPACVCTIPVYGLVVLVSGDGRNRYGWFGFFMLVVTVAIVAAGCWRRMDRRLMWCLLSGAAVLNLIGNGWLLFSQDGLGYGEEFVEAGTVRRTLAASPEAEAPPCGENEFFRVDADSKSSENAALVNENYGVSSYFSISNPNRIRSLLETEDGGVQDSMFKISGMDGRTYLDARAGVKYYAVPAEAGGIGVPYGFRFVKPFRRGGKEWELYENDYFLPLGITFDSYVKRENAIWETGLERQDAMLKTVVLKEEAPGIRQLPALPAADVEKLPYRITASEKLDIQDDTVRVKRGGASLTLEWEDAYDGECYVRLGSFSMPHAGQSNCDIEVSCGGITKTIRALNNRWNWYFGRQSYMLNLGLTGSDVPLRHDDHGKISCTIRFSGRGTFSLSDLNVYVQRMDSYEETVMQRKENVLEQISVKTNRVCGEIDVAEPKLLVLSVPYSKGWRARVDGRYTQIYEADEAYMAISLEPGRHKVELVYTTPYIKAGGVVSLIGWAGFICYIAVSRKKERRSER